MLAAGRSAMKLKVLIGGKWTITAPMTKKGSSELEDFLDDLGSNYEANVAGVLTMMEQHSELGPEHFNTCQCHYIDQKEQIYEYIKGRIRVFWFEDEDRVVICTHGILKKTQKTPRHEIDRAKRAKAAYMLAKQSGKLEIVEE